jgi:hypothetical protein
VVVCRRIRTARARQKLSLRPPRARRFPPSGAFGPARLPRVRSAADRPLPRRCGADVLEDLVGDPLEAVALAVVESVNLVAQIGGRAVLSLLR